MITKEQIKKLKQGDPIIIHGTFEGIVADGDICVKSPMTFYSAVRSSDIRYVPPSAVSIVEPQPDLCRKFKKGDKVRLTKWNGRICEKFFRAGIYCGENLTVVRAEDCFLNVTVRTSHGIEKAILSPFLELSTPVEEIDPYSVQETMSHDGWQIVRDGLPLAIYDSRRHPHAKETAEAECEKLNAEWKKEQNND